MCTQLEAAQKSLAELPPKVQAEAAANAGRIREQGMRAFGESYGTGPSRQRHRQKDPRGFAEFLEQLKKEKADQDK